PPGNRMAPTGDSRLARVGHASGVRRQRFGGFIMSYGYPAPQGYNAYSGYGTPYPVRRSAPASIHTVAIIQYIGGLLALAMAALLALVAFGGASRYSDDINRYG